MQPVRVKKRWMWVSEQRDKILETKRAALRKVNGKVDGVLSAVTGTGYWIRNMVPHCSIIDTQ